MSRKSPAIVCMDDRTIQCGCGALVSLFPGEVKKLTSREARTDALLDRWNEHADKKGCRKEAT